MTKLVLGAVADDYTGASDLANTLTRCGLRTVQTIGIPDEALTLPPVDAVVIALKSRSIEAADAVARSREADAWLRAHGAAHVMFKICSTFDSTDAGNIGPVMDALQSDCDEPVILVTPAFPATGRTVYQGNLFVGSLPLDESPLKDHPLNPMRDADLVRVLSRQSSSAIGLINLPTVAKGVPAILDSLVSLRSGGTRAAIVDAVFESDLEAIGEAALAHRFSVGASGLGLGLARAIVARSTRATTPIALDALTGPVACLAGSCSQATLEQIDAAAAMMPVWRLDPATLLEGGGEIERALNWAGERLQDGPLLIASSADAQAVAALQLRFGQGRIGTAIESAMAELASGLVSMGVRRMVVAGGETSGAVVDRLGLRAFLLGPEIAPGVPLLASLGGDKPMLMALKSGNFGGRTFFNDAVAAMSLDQASDGSE